MHGSLQNLCYPGRVMRDDKADGVWSLLLLHAVHQTSCSVSGILTDLCHASGTCDEMPDVQSCMQAQRAPRKWLCHFWVTQGCYLQYFGTNSA